MARLEYTPVATGAPGIEPRWTHSAKDIIGTAYATASRIWYTVSRGVLSEIYFPTLDRPQVRDLQFLVTDGESFFHDAHRNLVTKIEYLGQHGLGVRLTNSDPAGRYQLIAEVIADPHQPCVLIDTELTGDPAFLRKLHVYVMIAPHLEVGGWGNNGNAAIIAGREFLTANKAGTWLALAATAPFVARSCGYVGTTDGWQDISRNYRLESDFAAATDGNIALTGEIDLHGGFHFTVGLAFGRTLHRAVTTLFQSLAQPFVTHRTRFLEQWERAVRRLHPLEQLTGDGGTLYWRSRELIMAHEDKSYPGALIASLSIPWGEVKGDEDLGGYHLVWTRDMVNSATGLMAAGDMSTPVRALIYLACSQHDDGGFAQNFWVDGDPYWNGIQLDEVAFPIMLAWRLYRAEALANFDPYPMVRMAASYLINHGPATPQERWEENSGYSPSTLASNIAALICAAAFARVRGDEASAGYLEDYADFLEAHVETWTVTNAGTLVPGIRRHYIRLNPEDVNDPVPKENPDDCILGIKNAAPGAQWEFPARDVVDGGFLELVRYGIRKGGNPLMEDSLRVIDAVLKTEFPAGPCWRRYNHDGYGQRDDGGAFIGWGVGRPWPLLTGERGHYELAAGRDAAPYRRAMEKFATTTRMLPEQIWDGADNPQAHLYFGGPTGAAMPLMWAHAEYVKLLRSVADGAVFDRIPEVAERYLNNKGCKDLEIWKHNRQVQAVPAGSVLRVQAPDPFALHWSKDEWQTPIDSPAQTTAVGICFVDIAIASEQRAPLRFTFRWTTDGRWEGRDYAVAVSAR